MKKLLLTLITLFVLGGTAFALDMKDFAKKVETFGKSGSYIKVVFSDYDVDGNLCESEYCYILKQHVIKIDFEDDYVNIYTGDDKLYIYDGRNNYKITKTYNLDGNLVIEFMRGS